MRQKTENRRIEDYTHVMRFVFVSLAMALAKIEMEEVYKYVMVLIQL